MTIKSQSWIGTKEAASLLNVSQRTIQKWIDEGKIISSKTLGGHRRIDKAHLYQLLPEEKQQETPAESRPLIVLQVEDSALLRQLCELRFQSFKTPYVLHSAQNGYEGLRLIGKHQPDLLLTDLRMPNIDGFEMIRELQADKAHQNLRIVVITALGSDEIQRRGGLPESVTILGKPIPFASLENIFAQRAMALGLSAKPLETVAANER